MLQDVQDHNTLISTLYLNINSNNACSSVLSVFMKSLEPPVSTAVCSIYAWVISPGVFRSSTSTSFLGLPNSRPPVAASMQHSVIEFVIAYIGKPSSTSDTNG